MCHNSLVPSSEVGPRTSLALIDQGIHEPQRGDVVEVCLHEPLLPDDLRPHSLHAGHGLLELQALVLPVIPGPLYLEMAGQHRPQILPLIDVPLGIVKCLIRARHHGNPDRLHDNEPHGAGVAEPLPSDEDEGPRPAQDGTLLVTDGGVNAQAGDQVPRAPRRESQHSGGAVHGPGDIVHMGVDEGVLEIQVVCGRGRSSKKGPSYPSSAKSPLTGG